MVNVNSTTAGLFIIWATVSTVVAFVPSSSKNQAFRRSPSKSLGSSICIVVEAEILPDRRDEFLEVMEKDAVGSRAEPGCLRFGTNRKLHSSLQTPNMPTTFSRPLTHGSFIPSSLCICVHHDPRL
jgi:hypothetical protein